MLKFSLTRYVSDESGAITVDWTVLASAAVGMAIATTAVMTDTIQGLSGRMDSELRSRQLSDEWIQFYASHFGPVLESGYMSETQVEEIYDIANGMMNNTIMTHLSDGITAMEEGTISEEELVQLISVASVAYQRNLADDGMLNHYFGFDGSTPFYETLGILPSPLG